MNREILFRGKRVDNGEWVYGYYSVFHNKPVVTQISHQIFVPKEDAYFCGSMIGGFWYEVDPATVGQFTGLLDWNGKKIFEGDIVKWEWLKTWAPYHEGFPGKLGSNIEVATVVFKNGYFEPLTHPICNGIESLTGGVKFEVVGNIYDKENTAK